MIRNKLQLIVLLASTALFAIGTGVRAQMTNNVSPPSRPRFDRGPMQMMKQSLNLTDEQAKQLEPVFKKQQAMINALRTNTALSRQERAARMREIRQTSDTKLQSLLTPEQAEKWKAGPAHMRLLQTAAAGQTNRFFFTNQLPRWSGATTNQPPRWPRRLPAAQPPPASSTSSPGVSQPAPAAPPQKGQ